MQRVIKETRIREELVNRCDNVLRETQERVKMRWRKKEEFRIRIGIRQSCPLNPSLFTLFW